MSRPQKVALQRCFLFGNASRGVEDAAPYKRELRFFDKLLFLLQQEQMCLPKSSLPNPAVRLRR